MSLTWFATEQSTCSWHTKCERYGVSVIRDLQYFVAIAWRMPPKDARPRPMAQDMGACAKTDRAQAIAGAKQICEAEAQGAPLPDQPGRT